jgi:hypothetical protein
MSEEFDDDESEGEPCPYCAEPNHLPSDTRCIHNVAWTWDGQTEALGSATQLAEAWATLCNAVYEVEEDSPEDAQLQARALTLPMECGWCSWQFPLSSGAQKSQVLRGHRQPL